MLEIMMGIAVVVLMAKIATLDDQSSILWGSITFGLCVASMWLPLPFFRMIGAGVASFVLMFIYKLITRQ